MTRFPHDDFDPDGARLPIKVDTASNGEYAPQPLTLAARAANALAHRRVDMAAGRTGLGRRAFLTSSMGAAATLLAFNEAHAAAGARGGRFDLPADAAFDTETASAALCGDEFIFDVQTHCVDPSGGWAQGEEGKIWRYVLNRIFPQRQKCEADGFDCYSAEQLVKEVFLDSDTDIAVVSALWGARDSNPTPTEYAAEAQAIAERTGGHRALIHGGVLPNEPGALDFMEVQAREYKVSAWKLYPQWGPEGTGYWMDGEEYGIPVLERARELGVKVICAHRGLPLSFLDYEYSHPADIARAAKLFPDLTFICYHSGFEPGVTEGPYNPKTDKGVDRLIRAHQEAGFTRNSGNLYAELGSTWRYFMSRPEEAAHVMGKLLKYFGDERICWGTDSLWYGSPQDQIQAFRTFQISEEFQEKFGYPPLTDEARRRIFGLNAASAYGLDVEEIRKTESGDALEGMRKAYREKPNPSFATFGPKNRRQFLTLLRKAGGRPG
ncbi:MAG: amidohydrolase family protein [Alphaproteobacteria bacterium]